MSDAVQNPAVGALGGDPRTRTGGSDDQRAAHGTWTLAVLAALLIAVLLSQTGTIQSLLFVWGSSDSMSFGYLIGPIALYMIASDRKEIAAAALRPGVLGLVGAALLSVAWLAANVLSVQVVQQLALVGMLVSVVWAFGGWPLTRLLISPLAYLLLAVPIWSAALPVLQQGTAVASAAIVRGFGVPVFLDGYFLSVPNGSFVVAEVCAGLRYLMATMSIVALLAWQQRPSWRFALVILPLGVGFALILNWVRVVVIIMTGHLFGMEHPLVSSHNTFGWGLFAVGLVLLCYFAERLAPRMRDRAPEMSGKEKGGQKVGATVSRSTTSATRGRPARWGAAAMGAAAVVLVGMGPVVSSALSEPETGSEGARSGPGTPPVPGWIVREGSGHLASGWDPSSRGATWERLDSYTPAAGGTQVDAFVAVYRRQGEGRELVSELNRLYSPDEWHLARHGAVSVEGVQGVDVAEETEIRRAVPVSSGDRELMIWSWYYVADAYTTSPIVAKLQQLKGALTGKHHGARIAISTSLEDGQVRARTRLADFMTHFGPALAVQLATGP